MTYYTDTDAGRTWADTVLRDYVAELLRRAPTPSTLVAFCGPGWYRAHREDPSYWPTWWRDTDELQWFEPPTELPRRHPLWGEPRPSRRLAPDECPSPRAYSFPLCEVVMLTPTVEHRGEQLGPVLLHPPQVADMIEAFELPARDAMRPEILRGYYGPGGAVHLRPLRSRYDGPYCGP